MGGPGKEWPAFPIVIHEHCQNRMKQGVTRNKSNTQREYYQHNLGNYEWLYSRSGLWGIWVDERWVEFQEETVQRLQSKGVWSMLSEKRNVQFVQGVEKMDGSSWKARLKRQSGASLGDQGIGICRWLLFTLFSCWNFSVLMHVQLCLTLWDPNDYSSLGLSVHGILQERILEWVAMPSSRVSSWSKDQTHISWFFCVGRQVLYH